MMCSMVYSQKADHLVYRSMATEGNQQRLGIGFIKKRPGVDALNLKLGSFALVYVLEGEGRYINGVNEEFKLSSGSVFIRHPMESHSTYIDSNSPWAEYFIELDRSLYGALLSLKVLKSSFYVGQIFEGRELFKEFNLLCERLEKASEKELSTQGLNLFNFVCTLLSMAQKERFSQELIQVEQSCLDFALSLDKRINLKAYCLEKGWGYEAFRKKFYSYMGLSPGQYIIHRRMDEAIKLLKGSDKNLKEISNLLGYKSPYEFSAQFKKFVGKSPSFYRNI